MEKHKKQIQMSKNSSKQLVEQVQSWVSWIAAVGKRNQNNPKKYEKKVAYEGKKEYVNQKG